MIPCRTVLFLAACLSLMALCAQDAAAADPPGDPRLRLEGLPNFIFADEPVEILIGLCSPMERGRRPWRTARQARKATILLTGPRLFQAATGTAQVPPYSEQGVSAPFALDCRILQHGDVLTVKASYQGAPPTQAEVVLLYPSRTRRSLRLVLDHFEDGEGRRVIFLVPRVSESARRRWYPIKAAVKSTADRGRALLVGSTYGNGAYAQKLAKLWSPNPADFLPPAFAQPGDGRPILRLLLAALRQRQTQAEAIFVFPGVDDVRAGSPLEEYGLALHAILSVFDGHAKPSTRLVLATPAPYLASPVQFKHYRQAALRVTRERCWVAADLDGVLSPPPPTDRGSPPVPRYPDAEVHGRIARRLARAAFTDATAWLALLIPSAVFLFSSGALLWLRLRGRHRPPKRS